MKKHSLFFSTFFGAVFGYIFLHPFGMMAHQVHFGGEEAFIYVDLDNLLPVFKMAFSTAHLPPAILYIVLGMVMGFFIGKTIIAYQTIAKQHESFSRIGVNASSIIHDLNNPVSTIKLCIWELKKNTDDNERARVYKEMERDIRRLSRMVTDIKIVAQGDKLIQLSKSPVKLAEFLRAIASAAGLKHEIKIDCAFDGEVLIDKDYFERVIWNLLKNADEALTMTEGGRIEVSAGKANGSAVICVSDNGPGMPGEMSRSLSEFGKTFNKKGGIGIGLYNCKIITEAHGGKIWIISEKGKGAKVYISIPL